jgi:hypothetical protein
MSNVTWQEPQILADLLSLNLYASDNGLHVPGSRELAIVSPWLSNIELSMNPGPWYHLLTLGESKPHIDLLSCVRTFREHEWRVQLAVLAYGTVNTAIPKPVQDFETERRWLRQAMAAGAEVYLVPNLHAKGIVTPLGIITGSTNLTHSGMYLQSQNSNYFPYSHPDFEGNRIQLLSKLRPEYCVNVIPEA